VGSTRGYDADNENETTIACVAERMETHESATATLRLRQSSPSPLCERSTRRVRRRHRDTLSPFDFVVEKQCVYDQLQVAMLLSSMTAWGLRGAHSGEKMHDKEPIEAKLGRARKPDHHLSHLTSASPTPASLSAHLDFSGDGLRDQLSPSSSSSQPCWPMSGSRRRRCSCPVRFAAPQ
jgi:hypothetical protein